MVSAVGQVAWFRCALTLALVPTSMVPAVRAFESVVPTDSVHDHITADAATPLGWNGTGLQALQQAVLMPDVSESKVKGDPGSLIILDAAGDYEPAHHCDRLPPTPDVDVLEVSSAYIRLERDTALQFIHAGQADRAVAALGRALHALQDCYSHSDISEKEPESQASFLRAILGGEGGMDGVRFTAFQPGLAEPALPPGDPYPHGLYAKDGTNSSPDAGKYLPSGQTKFEAAAGLATSASQSLLQEFLDGINATEKAEVFKVGPTGVPKDSSIPAAGPLHLLVILALAGLAARRRTR